jgi:hypothetical protein
MRQYGEILIGAAAVNGNSRRFRQWLHRFERVPLCFEIAEANRKSKFGHTWRIHVASTLAGSVRFSADVTKLEVNYVCRPQRSRS